MVLATIWSAAVLCCLCRSFFVSRLSPRISAPRYVSPSNEGAAMVEVPPAGTFIDRCFREGAALAWVNPRKDDPDRTIPRTRSNKGPTFEVGRTADSCVWRKQAKLQQENKNIHIGPICISGFAFWGAL